MKIEPFFKRPGFQEKCESWRKREPLQNEYEDIYDGRVWKEFLTRTSTDFLKEKASIGLMLNVDWFSPFKHRRDYSVGALYISIMNLPREERFLKENILLVGIIPAMQKEPDTLNLCQLCITDTDLNIADRKLVDFLKCLLRLYGKEHLTINMHLHLHIKEVVLNFGTVYGFWLFTYEHYNGILGEL